MYPNSDPDHHQMLIICSLAHRQPSLKLSRKSVQKFVRKFANRQTNRQTNKNDDYISLLADVNIEAMQIVYVCNNVSILYNNYAYTSQRQI